MPTPKEIRRMIREETKRLGLTTRAYVDSVSGGVEAFDVVSQNIRSWDMTINYSGDDIASIVYTEGASTITKTINYTGSDIASLVLSGDTPSGIDLTKTFSYTGDNLTGAVYS